MFEPPLTPNGCSSSMSHMRRTYVRRRAVALAILAGVMSLPAAAVAVLPRGSTEPPPRTYVVRPGDTLWAIAQTYDPGGDPRHAVSDLAAVNGVDPGALVPGQVLRIRAG